MWELSVPFSAVSHVGLNWWCPVFVPQLGTLSYFQLSCTILSALSTVHQFMLRQSDMPQDY